jgi:hypothetical protein
MVHKTSNSPIPIYFEELTQVQTMALSYVANLAI